MRKESHKEVEFVKAVVRKSWADEIPAEGKYEGVAYKLFLEGGVTYAEVNRSVYAVTGTKRLYVKFVRPKKSSTNKPQFLFNTCKSCNNEFKASKYNPYIDECPNCRRRSKVRKPENTIIKVCEVTGKEFETSKFNPYIKISPEGRAILKAQQLAEGK